MTSIKPKKESDDVSILALGRHVCQWEVERDPNYIGHKSTHYITPSGYINAFTSKGQHYIKPISTQKEKTIFSSKLSLKEIGENWGFGTMMYFDFLRILCIFNGLLFGISIIPYCTNYDIIQLSDFLIPTQNKIMHNAWIYSSIVIIILWFSLGPLYLF